MIRDGEFVEHAEFGNNLYGTSKRSIEDISSTGRICVLDLELQGVRNMKALQYPAKYILIRAPSLEVLVSLLCMPLFYLSEKTA
jgi:guanylate kinase